MRRQFLIAILFAAAVTTLLAIPAGPSQAQKPAPEPAKSFTSDVRPLLTRYCLECHSTKVKKGSLDLERFATTDHVRKDLKPWQNLIEQLEAGEMPPKGKLQPTAEERKQLISWTRGFLDAEARARAGDPGHVPLRRLSNAEYDRTIRDLTGVDLRPAREFPVDGAAGEGFTNAAEALSDVSPTLLDKYLAAAKEISSRVVLLPDGFRFSPSKTRRDWTDESLTRLREFYQPFGPDGRLPLKAHLAALVKHRNALTERSITVDQVAVAEKVNAKYLGLLWQAFTSERPSYPLDQIRSRFRSMTMAEVDVVSAEIAGWQEALWKVVQIGSYRYGNTVRQVANEPPTAATQTLRLGFKPAPGQSEVVAYLSARALTGAKDKNVVWTQPRFEGAGKLSLMLCDYSELGGKYEVDFRNVFDQTEKYLAIAADFARNRKQSIEELAKDNWLDSALAKRWLEILSLSKDDVPEFPGRPVPIDAITLLDEQHKNDQKPAITGWRKKGTDLPQLVTNSSNTLENVPGRVQAHGVSVHPTPDEYVAAVWKSPIDGRVQVASRVAHAHPACGNGIAWWLERRRGERASVLAEGAISVGAAPQAAAQTLTVANGDLVIVAVDARNRDHVCDLTEIALTIDGDKLGKWDLAADIANNVLEGNPHSDKLGNKGVWSFVRGPARPTGSYAGALIPPGSVLAQWREAAIKKDGQAEAAKLAKGVQALLAGVRPTQDKSPDRILFDNLVSTQSPLLFGIDLSFFRPLKRINFGLPKEQFDKHANLKAVAGKAIEIRLPAAIFHEREFVVEGRVGENSDGSATLFQVGTSPPSPRWDGKSPVVAAPGSPAHKKLLQGLADFRGTFPMFVCYPNVIPLDEVVTLKMYHREDDDLIRMFLTDDQKNRIDYLWNEHRFISQQPIAENKYLPQFIGFVTQDQPKELLAYFESQRPVFQKRADEFEKELDAAIPKQLDSLLEFASRAYRRPLTDGERTQLLSLYETVRKKGDAHDEAFRNVLARVLVAPAFLFRIEQPPTGKDAGPVNDWELATRLSYFLWSSAPDTELRRLAATGRLRDPKALAEQAMRMVKDGKSRALANEFGAQWLHVRGFEDLKEKNEKLFPTFDAALRKAIDEETVLFFQDLFQSDRPVSSILDADYTFLNETLANHYGIPGVSGPQWRRVEGVRKFGRGGVLGLASVQTKESGASRTSPVLRGNWVVETLLGEKLPRPPANVPRLPEDESSAELSVRELTEKHTRVAECAVCHVRIDPFGFAFEKYDPIGRFREKDLAGRPVDTKVKLKDGTEFDGLDGLRRYLLDKKKDVIVRLFCKKLLGYALGRATTLSDTSLIDEMVEELNKNGGRVSAAVMAIVKSPQFRLVRGADRMEE